MIMKDADFGHIPWIIANDDRFAYVGRQGEIEIPQALEMNAIGAHLATFGHRQQQQIELFEAFGEPGEKTTAFPSGLRRITRLTVGMPMIVVQNKSLQLGFKGRTGKSTCAGGIPAGVYPGRYLFNNPWRG